MPYTGFAIANASAAAFPAQARWFAQDVQILSDADHGNGVLSGCVVSQRAAGANMSCDVAAGTILRETATVAVAGGNAVISAAHATLPRLDLVSANNVGALVVTTGTAAAVPEPPTIPQVSNVNNIVLAFVYVPAADTAINTNQITDKRVLVTAPGGGSGAPTTADYLVRTTNAGLSAERVVTDTASVTWDWSTPGQAKANAPAAGGGDFSSNTTVSVDGEAVVFSSTLGKTGKRATGTGPARLTSGVLGTGSTNLASEVTGDLPYANLAPATAASRLLGRGSASGAGDWQEITPGSGLTMTGTTLTASGTGGSVTVRKNTGADVGTRPRLNLVEGSNVTLTVADDAGSNEVDITIAASGGGGSSDIIAIVAADVVHATNSTTLTDITGLTFSTTASPTELWLVEILLIMHMNSVGGTGADYKFGWTVSGAQTGTWGGNPETGIASGATGPTPAASLAQALAYGSLSIAIGPTLMHLRALVQANSAAGAVQLQFAQNTTVAGAIATAKANSVLIARKVRI